MNRDLPTFYAAEERNKLSHFTVQGYDLHGIIQGGASDGEEMENAIRLGIENYIAFEPLKSAYEKLTQIPTPTGYFYHLVNLGLHDTNSKAELQVTLGDGKGSSIFETEWEHPEVLRNWNQGQAAIIGNEEIEMVRFDDWMDSKPMIFMNQFDTLQLDTQGNEMEILKGFGKYLKDFKYLCIELSITPVYKGETPGHEVAAWLAEQGFTQDSPIYEHNDSFFIRSDIKSESDQTYRGRC